MRCHVRRWSLRQRQHCTGAACAQSLVAGRFVADERGALHLLHPLTADVRPEHEVVCESRVASCAVQPAAWNTSYWLQFNRSFSALTNASCLQYTKTYTYSNFHANFKAYEYE